MKSITDRSNYKMFAKEKLHLICAVGDKTRDVPKYFFLHNAWGFEEIARECVWDIYDFERDAMSRLRHGGSVTPEN